MKRIALSRVFLSALVSSLCTLAIACGGGPSSAPPPLGQVASTKHPLVAQYTVESACGGQAMVEFGPDTSYGRTTAWYPISAGYQKTNILVAGMRASTTYHMRSQVQCQDATLTSQDTTFKTGPLPAVPFPTLQVRRPNPSLSSTENPGIEQVTINAPSVRAVEAVVADRDGNPIWYYNVGPENVPFTFKLLNNGHMLITVDGLDIALLEVDLAGNTIREMDIATLDQKMQAAGYDFIPGSYHHDFLPLDNGHVIVLTNFYKSFTDLPGYPGTLQVLGDGLIDLDADWNPVWAWNSFDYLDVNRHPTSFPDWTHSNALVYSASDGNLLLSMRNQSWLLKIDYNNGAGTGNVLWKFGYQGDFSLSDVDDPSVWFSNQHFPSVISQSGPQTTLAIWDNGDSRVLDSSGSTCGSPPTNTPCYSAATIFQIDESAMSANLGWADLPGYFGVWGGSINQLSNGNVEFDINAFATPPNPNVASEVQEVTQTGTPQVVWLMDVMPITLNAYRAYRVPSLYPGVSWQY